MLTKGQLGSQSADVETSRDSRTLAYLELVLHVHQKGMRIVSPVQLQHLPINQAEAFAEHGLHEDGASKIEHVINEMKVVLEKYSTTLQVRQKVM